jgi:hypothetical protein
MIAQGLRRSSAASSQVMTSRSWSRIPEIRRFVLNHVWFFRPSASGAQELKKDVFFIFYEKIV